MDNMDNMDNMARDDMDRDDMDNNISETRDNMDVLLFQGAFSDHISFLSIVSFIILSTIIHKFHNMDNIVKHIWIIT